MARFDGYHDNSEGLARRALRSSRWMRPSPRWITRSAMPAMAALCVITTAGGAQLAVDALDHLQHQLAGGVVQRAGGLVAQQHLRALDDGAGDGHALLLAARELDGKWSRRGARPTRAAPRRHPSAPRAMSVTRLTFSRTVRLGIRL
jgi:hypothetical protein